MALTPQVGTPKLEDGQAPPAEHPKETLRASPCPVGGDSHVLCDPWLPRAPTQAREKENVHIRGHQVVSAKAEGSPSFREAVW